MEMIQLFLVGLCCTTLKDQLRRVVNVSAFRLIQYRKSKTKVLIFANQSAGEYHQEPVRTQGQQNTIIIMTIFNEETFSLKSGLQKGPQKLKIKNLQ